MHRAQAKSSTPKAGSCAEMLVRNIMSTRATQIRFDPVASRVKFQG
jgi:hypothetical protein